MLTLDNEFHDFFEKIKLNSTQKTRIKSAVDSLTEFLSKEYNLQPDEVFAQGSFSTNTVTKPAPSVKDGEYDVDLVVLCSTPDQIPNESLDGLLYTLESNGIYKDKVEKDNPKSSCIRLRYADENKARFHVDIVPARRVNGSIIEIPRRNGSWEVSNPKKYTQWILNLGERFQRTLMFLRRWRDEHEVPVKSIVLQVLVAKNLSDAINDSQNLTETLENIASYTSSFVSPPKIFNPVLEEENLTKKWSQEDYDTFKTELNQTIKNIEKNKDEKDHDKSCEIWQMVLGEDFVYQTNKEFAVIDIENQLGDCSHAKTLSYYSIPFIPNPDVKIEIQGELKSIYERFRFSGKLMKQIRLKPIIKTKLLTSGTPVESHKKIKFNVHVYGMKDQDYEIYWQVVNTGIEAKSAQGLRGEIFLSEDPLKKKWNDESTLYEGVHWIEAYVVKNNVCVARSGRFYVPIVHN